MINLLLQRFNTRTFKRNIGILGLSAILMGVVINVPPLIIPRVFDLPAIKAAQAERIRLAENEADKQVECLLENKQWKHVDRRGFICIPKYK